MYDHCNLDLLSHSTNNDASLVNKLSPINIPTASHILKSKFNSVMGALVPSYSLLANPTKLYLMGEIYSIHPIHSGKSFLFL